MQYALSMAMVEAVSELTADRLRIRLKWPNDLYADSLKIGGVLCESRYDADSKRYVVTSGIGLNVDNRNPTICVNELIRRMAATAQADADQKMDDSLTTLRREEILSVFANHFERLFEALQKEGFGPLKERYLKYWLHSGQKVSVEPDAQGMNG